MASMLRLSACILRAARMNSVHKLTSDSADTIVNALLITIRLMQLPP